eukprot:gnl/MRDRNA2_/MRDRNA2_75323_c0_seq1.p1 gnl/MRDRNA2_/MRDRNA2_75323_c0~~gnl/MRDRNA2_/MRDRNA2_75323_c0_seq1.p1  ORF type:complete len:434 (+),score=75.56 gnl/MRDRNA2_/MRDRNA2_75323_c0_seq1:114-1415(+)
MGQSFCHGHCCRPDDASEKESNELTGPIGENALSRINAPNLATISLVQHQAAPDACNANSVAQAPLTTQADIKQPQSATRSEDCTANADVVKGPEPAAPANTVPMAIVDEAPACATTPKGEGPKDRIPGTGLFWVFVTAMHDVGQKVLGLRNCVQLEQATGFHYVKLSRAKGGGYGRTKIKINQGDSFGQWCRVSDSVQQRLLENFKDISFVKGKAVKDGLPPTQEAERSLPDEKPIPDEDMDVQYFEDTQDRLPLGLEKSFNISCFELKGEAGKVGPALKKDYSQISNLPFGLPSGIDEFRSSPLSGIKQGSGFVPALNGQQFCIGSECTFVWVRFDEGDLNTFEHNFQNVPVCRDGNKGFIFPVTHLWVDLVSLALEWFLGKKCLARKKLNLWWLPGPVLRSVVSLGMRRLTETQFEDDTSDEQTQKIKGA